MALLTHPGSGSTDLGARYLNRDDVSDLLFASLVPENNLLGNLEVGAEFVATRLNWLEDKLNNAYVTDNTNGGLTSGGTTWTVNAAADAALLDIGYVLMDDTLHNYFSGEQIQVTAINGTSITIIRGYGGTSATTHANATVWRIIDRPVYEGSGVGPDQSKKRVSNYNIINRFRLDVQITQEQLAIARAGAAPGVPSELRYQFEQRLSEMKRTMAQAFLYARASGGAGSTTYGDYATMAGIISWLDGTWNSNSSATNESNATLNDGVLNSLNKTLLRNGAVPKWVVGGTNAVDNISRMYNDRIRIVQNEETRGFAVKEFDTTMGNTLRIIWDNWLADNQPLSGAATTNQGLLLLLDPDRIRIRPFAEAFFYILTAPTLTDTDVVSAISKVSLEMRNTGTDAGAAHALAYNLNF